MHSPLLSTTLSSRILAFFLYFHFFVLSNFLYFSFHSFSRLFYFVVVLLLFGLFGSRIRESSSLSFNFSVIQVLKSSRVAYTTATESLFLCRCPIDKTWIFTPTDRVRSYLAVWSKFLLKSLLLDCLLRL